MRFFHPMDARWCCPSTVFFVFFYTFVPVIFFNHVVFLLSASRSINCAASSERTIAIIVCMFCGPIVLAHGCYMTREFRREGVLSTIPKAGKLSGLELHVIIQVATYYFLMKAPASDVNIAESDKI